jgi:hypothetical protein
VAEGGQAVAEGEPADASQLSDDVPADDSQALDDAAAEVDQPDGDQPGDAAPRADMFRAGHDAGPADEAEMRDPG